MAEELYKNRRRKKKKDGSHGTGSVPVLGDLLWRQNHCPPSSLEWWLCANWKPASSSNTGLSGFLYRLAVKKVGPGGQTPRSQLRTMERCLHVKFLRYLCAAI
ncbi:predicted protein [Coccidioides posadasii str. Silveira]|uniref:Predicted protein n=1 Tax=Coccidioides posadasii (strain RMSCC 757 / Silveira) TaxID=443226 RepID=E9D6P7_COCPS|nr:predicted protein [Coccidioides posadasii str. Silveira]